MRKFISNQQVIGKLNSESEDNSLKDLLQPFQNVKGSLKHEVIPELPLLESLSPSNCSMYAELSKLLPPVKQGYLNSDELCSIDVTLRAVFGECYVHQYSHTLLFQGTV